MVYYMPTSNNEEDKRPKLGPRLIPCIFVGYKLYPGGVWRDEYLVIDFEAFQATRAGLHIADHDTKEIYVPGIAPVGSKLGVNVQQTEGTAEEVHNDIGVARRCQRVGMLIVLYLLQ